MKPKFPTVREKNAAFDSLSPADKRVAVAQDVLNNLDMKVIAAKHRFYAVTDDFLTREVKLWPHLKNDGLHEVSGTNCNVCAIGAVAVSLFNGEVVGEMRRDELVFKLKDYFPSHMLDAMEAVFEGDGKDPEFIYDDHIFKSEGTAEEKLRSIMNNIIRYNGVFNAYEYEHTPYVEDTDEY